MTLQGEYPSECRRVFVAQAVHVQPFGAERPLSPSAGDPSNLVASEVGVIVKDPEVIAEFDKIGAEAAAESGADYFARILREEADRVARAIATAGIKPQ